MYYLPTRPLIPSQQKGWDASLQQVEGRSSRFPWKRWKSRLHFWHLLTWGNATVFCDVCLEWSGCFARLHLSGNLATESRLSLGLFFLCAFVFLGCQLLQPQVWDTLVKKETKGIHHCVLSWIWRLLASQPSFNFSESYVCFIYIVQGFQLCQKRVKYVYSISLEAETFFSM